MNIGSHGYASWMRNTPPAGYGNRKTEEKTGEKETENLTYREQILAHMEEMAKKVKEGKVEPSFQIGGQSFTVREWKKLLADFDDAAEGLQEQMKELIAEVEKQAEKEALRRRIEGGAADPNVVTNVSVPEAAQPKAESSGSVAAPTASKTEEVKETKGENVATTQVTDPEELLSLLTDEVTKCTYPTDDPKHKHWYITCYGQDGIRCREAYFENGKWVNRDCWSFSYTEEGQYEKVMAFLQRFPQDANLRFASHEDFWKDFLAGEIDEDDFVHFYQTSMKDGAHFYTAEEMELIQRAVINENRKGLQKISGYDGQMTIPEGAKTGDGKEEEDDLKTQIITKPDGSVVLQIETNFGVMEVEVTEAQKFGLQYNPRPGFNPEETRFANPFARGAGAVAAYEAAGL